MEKKRSVGIIFLIIGLGFLIGALRCFYIGADNDFYELAALWGIFYILLKLPAIIFIVIGLSSLKIRFLIIFAIAALLVFFLVINIMQFIAFSPL